MAKKRKLRTKKVDKPETEEELRLRLLSEADYSDDEIFTIDDAECHLVYFFQKELHVTLTDDYSVARFNILKEEAIKESERIKREQEKNKNGN